MKRVMGVVFACAVSLIASAHVGSPNVFFDGTAGPYDVRVVIKPPMVVPGVAQVIVRTRALDVERVVIRPVFWRPAAAGAPKGDVATKVPGQVSTYSGRLWLMARGAYSVYVTVEGPRGSGTAIVPVMSFATGRLGISPGLTAILFVLAVLLVVALVTIVRAAAGESLVAPGAIVDARVRRRANIATAVAVPVIAIFFLGGAKWWSLVDKDYQRTMFRPPTPSARLDSAGQLVLSIRDTTRNALRLSPIFPDHGKMMHLFVIADSGMRSFAHLHPVQTDSTTFRAAVPPLPAGRYRLYADVTTETGTSMTLTSSVELPPARASAIAPSDSDDAWTNAAATTELRPRASATIGDGLTMFWAGDSALVNGRETDLRFVVKDASGKVARLRDYMDMLGHAVVARDDGSVFIHLHPMGTVSVASQMIFFIRDRGDTTPGGRPAFDMVNARDCCMTMPGELSFPYEFPKPGRYRIWVQVKHDEHVLTGTFNANVR